MWRKEWSHQQISEQQNTVSQNMSILAKKAHRLVEHNTIDSLI